MLDWPGSHCHQPIFRNGPRRSGIAAGAGTSDLAGRRLSAAGTQGRRFHASTRSAGLGAGLGKWYSLEDYPGDGMHAVLNGWCFAPICVEDLRLAMPDPLLDAARDRNAGGLARVLPKLDAGYWSCYSVASPLYHDLHIAQLRTSARIFPAQTAAYLATADQFESYRKHRPGRVRTVVVRVVQKLLQPAVGEMA